MKKTLLSAIAIMVFIILALTGCGHDHNNAQPTIVTQIFSDQAFDGDILENPPGVFTITQGMSINKQSVLAGVDPITFEESRAFLDFPLSGQNGVPINAVIVSATLDIVIDNVKSLGGTIPIRIDLVSFQPPILLATDFDLLIQPALATTTILISSANVAVNPHVVVDVTSLMVQAQNLGLPDFQVRILEDPGPPVPFPGLIEIDDTTGANQALLAPLLQVQYF
jgi:hypothetical protein